ncbi:MAG: hypothetical protein AAFY39_18815, partial [Pseudomonadota bacterium]
MFKYLMAATLMASPLAAQDFSEGSEARSWNLYAEKPARFEARVVDLVCEFTGDCPDDCGAGKRQLGLLRTADDVLVLAMKNSQPAFTGAAVELQPYCNQTITVDGLLIDDPDLGATQLRPGIETALRLDDDGLPVLDGATPDTVIVLCDGATEEGPAWVGPML